MIAVFARCTVVKGKEKEFLDLAHNLAQKSREENANISYDVLCEKDKSSNEFYFLEKWQDKKGLDLHMQTEHFVKTIEAVNKIIDGELEIHLYENV